MRARPPFSTTKREPDNFAAVSKSIMPERFAQLEMLLRLERVFALRAGLVMLDVAVLVLAVRHFGERQVRDRRENLVQLLLGRLRLLLQRRQRHLQLVDLGHQLLRRGLVLLRLGLRRSPSRPRSAAPAPARTSGSRRGGARRWRANSPTKIASWIRRRAGGGSAPCRTRRRFRESIDVVHVDSGQSVRGNRSRSYNVQPARLSQRSAARIVCGAGRAVVPFSVSPQGEWSAGKPPWTLARRPADALRIGPAARHGRSPVTRGCRFRARWPSNVGPSASRRSRSVRDSRDRLRLAKSNGSKPIILGFMSKPPYSAGLTSVLPAAFAAASAFALAALPSTIFTDQIEPS